MGLLSFFSKSSDLEPGDAIEVLDESGDTVEAIRRGAREAFGWSSGRDLYPGSL